MSISSLICVRSQFRLNLFKNTRQKYSFFFLAGISQVHVISLKTPVDIF